MASQNYDSSGSTDLFVIMLFCSMYAIYLLLDAHFQYIAFVWKWLRLFELGLFYWIPDWFPFYGKLEIKEAFHFILATDYDLIHKDTVSVIDDRYAGWFSWLPGLICVYWGVKFMGKSLEPTATYDMERLILRMQHFFPHVPQFVEDNPIDKDIELNRNKKETYRWAMGMRPNDFALLQPPLGMEEAAKENKSLDMPIWDGNQAMDLDLAEKTFSAQLGEHFTGIGSLVPHEKRLYDFLSGRIAIDPSLAEEKITRYTHVILKTEEQDKKFKINNLSESELSLYRLLEKYIEDLQKKQKTKFNIESFCHYKNIESLIKNPHFNRVLRDLCSERAMSMHGFKTTAFMALLEEVRKSGVVPTLEFQWLKKHDRVLSFALSSVGRKVSFVECGGCFAHFIIEKQIGRPLTKPEVHEAVNGLYKALNLGDE